MNIYQYKIFQGQKWLKVFSHDNRNGKQFNYPDEALSFLNDLDRFSILSEISNRDKISNSFYFLIEFSPNDLFITWKQNDNPLTINESQIEATTVPGFKLLKWNCNITSFGGLARTSLSNHCIPSLLSGNINSDQWYYAIGVVESCQTGFDHKDQLPGPMSAVEQTTLWIRVSNYTCLQRKITIHTYIMIVLFVILSKQ